MTIRSIGMVACLLPVVVPLASAQTSSIGVHERRANAQRVPEVVPRETPRSTRNQIYDRYSWITLPPKKPKKFKVGDLITVIVREQRRFQSKSKLETDTEFDLQTQIEAFIKLTQGGVGPTTFKRGKPAIDIKYTTELDKEGKARRTDLLTMRLAGKIIDVKPNGVLVIEARARIVHDEEVSTLTLSGSCRKEDVTADNSILSTQIADKEVVVQNSGAMRGTFTRGWVPKLLDMLNPF